MDALAVPGPTWAQMFARHAHADRPAVVSASRVWTFRELTRNAAGWAAWLDSAGLPPGRPVAVPGILNAVQCSVSTVVLLVEFSRSWKITA